MAAASAHTPSSLPRASPRPGTAWWYLPNRPPAPTGTRCAMACASSDSASAISRGWSPGFPAGGGVASSGGASSPSTGARRLMSWSSRIGRGRDTGGAGVEPVCRRSPGFTRRFSRHSKWPAATPPPPTVSSANLSARLSAAPWCSPRPPASMQTLSPCVTTSTPRASPSCRSASSAVPSPSSSTKTGRSKFSTSAAWKPEKARRPCSKPCLKCSPNSPKRASPSSVATAPTRPAG